MKNPRSVSFDNQVRVRKHAMTIGDNPACKLGQPVGIDWELVEDGTTFLSLKDLEEDQERRYADAIEARKQKQGRYRSGPPVRKLNSFERMEIIEQAGCSKKEIRSLERKVNNVRIQRRSTQANVLFTNFFEKFGKRLQRKLRGYKAERRVVVNNWYQHYEDVESSQTQESTNNDEIQAADAVTAVEHEVKRSMQEKSRVADSIQGNIKAVEA